jgi:hypothetical protein
MQARALAYVDTVHVLVLFRLPHPDWLSYEETSIPETG